MILSPLLSALVQRLPFLVAISALLLCLDQSRSSHSLSHPIVVQAQTPSRTSAQKQFQSCQADIQVQQFLAAISVCQDAVNAFRQLGDRQNEAAALSQLGLVYAAVSRSWEAIDAYQKALSLYQAVNHPAGQATVLQRLGEVYQARTQYESAINYYLQAYVMHGSSNNLNGQAQALMQLGAVYQALSKYQIAIGYYGDALSRFYATNDRAGQARTLMNLGRLHHDLAQDQQAIAYYNEAMPILRSLRDRRGEAAGLMNLGNAYAALSETQRAIGYYKQALPLFLAVNDRQGEANAVLSLGSASHALAQYEPALRFQKTALRLFRNVEDRQGEADALNSLGLTYSNLTAYKTAIQHTEQALRIYKSIGDRNGEATALGNLGTASLKLNDLDAARSYLQQSIQILEAIRSSLQQDRDRISIFEAQQNPYVALQQVLIAQNNPKAALEVAERGRAQAFVALLARRLNPNPRQSRVGAIGGSPRSNVPAAIQPITIADMQKIAKDQNATLVEYAITGDEALNIWVVQPNGSISLRQSRLDVVLKQRKISLRQYVQAVRTETLGVRSSNRPTQPNSLSTGDLKTLHRYLIAPIADLLPQDPHQSVVLIPQGALYLVPFPALQDAKGQYLIQTHTLSTAPSIQVLQLAQNQKRDRPLNPLIVGNPTMPKLMLEPGKTTQLAPLPGAEREAKAIAQLLKTSALIGDQATETVVTKQMQEATLIHLATHGLLDEQRGIGSAIALAPTGTHDGLLTAEEIFNLKLQATLVVLSACDTGRGKITGDGVIGLSRSLISAGVPSVIVSLWAIPDAPTAALMTTFYQTLQTNPDKAQALRQAMLITMQKYPHPRNWAAFTLIGAAK